MNRRKIIDAMELSSEAYKNVQPTHPNTTVKIIDHPNGVQCYIRQQGEHMSITFRGSDSLRDWKTDLTFWKKVVPYNNTSSKIRVHTGFINAYKDPGVRDLIHTYITEDIHCITITGHSYGAALAVLCAVDVEYNFSTKDIEVITFGGPRIGNNAFVKSYNKRVCKTLRVENGNDIVTKVPFASWGYHHVGATIHVGVPRIFGLFSFHQHYPHEYYKSLIMKFLP